MPEPSLIAELQNHTGTLIVLVGTMGALVGVFAGALGNVVWNRLNQVEKRQEDLRGNVLPQLITKEDLKTVVETLEKVGMAFVDRVEDFMSSCRKGECAMALFIKNHHHKSKE